VNTGPSHAATRSPNWLLTALGAGVVLLVLGGAAAGFLVAHDSPDGLVNAVPLPHRVRPLTQVDGLNYRIHVGLGTLFQDVGAPPSATAAEWFKSAYHARTQGQLTHAANGLIAVEQRSSTAQVEATLCPVLHNPEPDSSGRSAREVQVLAMAGISCDAWSAQQQ